MNWKKEGPRCPKRKRPAERRQAASANHLPSKDTSTREKERGRIGSSGEQLPKLTAPEKKRKHLHLA